MERLLIVNPGAGKGNGLKYAKRIERWYKKKGIKLIIWPTAEDGSNRAFELGKRAAQEGFGLICLLGGDGTYSEVVNGMIASGIPSEQLPTLGLIRCGTGNNLAKNLGIPKNQIQALKVIENGQVAKIDIGKVILENEEKYFLNVVSFGMDAWITKMARRFKGKKYWLLPKKIHYLLAALDEIRKGMRFYPISINGQAPKEMILVAITNGPTYGAIFHIAPGADPQDGLLNICSIDCVGKSKALKDIGHLIRGTHTNLPEVSMSCNFSLTISSPKDLPCEIDGEVLPPEKEYQIEVLPQKLKVFVPLVSLKTEMPLCVQTPEPRPV